MDARFRPHNVHWDHPEAFRERDPHLALLSEQPLVYRSPLLDQLPTSHPGIYSLTGGRQVGKSTLLKQWMAERLEAGCPPRGLAYLVGELIDDHHVLVRLVTELLSSQPCDALKIVILDEITYTREWDRGIKYLADAGLLRDVVLLVTGSDAVLIRDARARLPGRRGQADIVDFHLFPLTFAETVSLRGRLSPDRIASLVAGQATDDTHEILLTEFELYLVHGGYLTALNDLAGSGTISTSTLATYADWIRGDMLKRGKQEHFLREVLTAVIRCYGSQVTWNALAKDLSIDHPATVGDYIGLLERMDVLLVQPALREDTLSAAPKKARKVSLADPFILHAVRSWLHGCADPMREQIVPMASDPEWAGKLTEACAAAHYRRFHPTFYIKAEGEVDIAYVKDGRFWPIEVKWTSQLCPKDLKQIRKYPNGLICSRHPAAGSVHGVASEPLPANLLRLGPSPGVLPR